MKRYVARRLLTGLLTVVVVMVLNFVIIHAAPGDPVRIMAGMEHPSEAQMEELRVRFGLDKPLWQQLFIYMGQVARGDLGTSYTYNTPVLSLIADTLGPSALLALTSCVLSFLIGTLLGLFTARHQGSWIDSTLSYVSYFFDSMPPFWLGLVSILVFASTLHLLPTSGMVNLRAQNTGWALGVDIATHLILPCGTMTLIQIPGYLRLTRSSVSQVMQEDYITTFRATGMSEKQIFRKYVLKNAILPTITVFGISLAYVVTGAALVEIVFAWPGIGRLMLNAINRRDYPLLMGIYLMLSVSVAVVTLAVDLLYAWIDPRIRLK
ncbi:MAG: ABC transporter permease [Clostridia bacterium]|nr:ABC transporter permease [Clostridia bacterium]